MAPRRRSFASDETVDVDADVDAPTLRACDIIIITVRVLASLFALARL